MASAPWQRHLLSVAREGVEGSLTVEAVAVAAAVAVVLVLVVMLCACKDASPQKNGTEPHGISRKSTVSTKNAEDPAAVTVDMAGGGETTHAPGSPGEATANTNGVAGGRNSNNSAMSHSRQASSGSVQIRPTSLRELPDLPGANHRRNHSGAGLVDKAPVARGNQPPGGGGEAAEGNSYDHLGVKISNGAKVSTNYDHITLESPSDLGSGVTPVSETDAASDGHYAQVRERMYELVKDVRRGDKASTSEYDPYSKVKDDDDREDPYTKVKDDPPYNKVKDTERDDDDVEDDYAHLRHDHTITPPLVGGGEDEDPYERVMGDSGAAEVMATLVDPDDPYTIVNEPSVTVVPIRSKSSAVQAVEEAGGAANNNTGAGRQLTPSSRQQPDSNVTPGHVTHGRLSAGAEFHLQYADEGEGQDDYAVVVKDRQGSMRREVAEVGGGGVEEAAEEEIEPYFSTPPEPPRTYGASEVGGAQGAVGGDDTHGSPRHDGKEHRYTKVTARESLASMTARNALNMYEIVPDLPENTYATVEGGSGDGVVRYATPSQPCLQHSSSQVSETYAEIGAATSGSYSVSAPEPPSLDSLHSMTKSAVSADGDHGNRAPGSPPSSFHGGHVAGSPPSGYRVGSSPPSGYRSAASPSGTGSTGVVVAADGYAAVIKASSFSPSETALPQIPRSSPSPNPTPTTSLHSLSSLGDEVTVNGVTFHPDYHRVKDSLPDQDNENDPNYESVDEALSKGPVSSGSVDAGSRSFPKVGDLRPLAQAGSVNSSGGNTHTGLKLPASPTRRTHPYEEVSPPSSPRAGQGSGVMATSPPSASANSSVRSGAIPKGQPSSGAVPKGQSSSGVVPKQQLSNGAHSAEAAEVRERVLQGHMYEEVTEVKKTNSTAPQKNNPSTAKR